MRIIYTLKNSLRHAFAQYLTPQLFKHAHRAVERTKTPSRWRLHPLVTVLISMAWGVGKSLQERFATARAAYVAAHQHARRPGTTLAGFSKAASDIPMPALRAFAAGVRQKFDDRRLDRYRVKGLLPVAVDGTKLATRRSAELQTRLGHISTKGKTDAAPCATLTTAVLLPAGLLWSWRIGKAKGSEQAHLGSLLPTLPERSLVVADAGFLGYDLFRTIVAGGASFLVRMSSRACLYQTTDRCMADFREGRVYYWPQSHDRPPLEARLIRVSGKNGDVWLLTNILDNRQLSRRTAARLYRWRWRNGGFFRTYKDLLGKVKLQSETVKLVHREVESSLLCLQLILARAADESDRISPRRMLLRLRAEDVRLIRSLGPRQFATYELRLQIVQLGGSSSIRQDWPRRKDHNPPRPPILKVMDKTLKAKMDSVLGREQGSIR